MARLSMIWNDATSRWVLAVFLILVVASAYWAFQAGASSNDDSQSLGSVEQKAEVLEALSDEVAEGETGVTVNRDLGLVCAFTKQGRASGGSCTTLDAEEPMIAVRGGESPSDTKVVVVDPQERLGSVLVDVDGEVLEAQSHDHGLSVAVAVSAVPDEVIVVDDSGSVVLTRDPKEKYEEIQQEAENIDESEDHIHH